jgi:hypothetical protein
MKKSTSLIIMAFVIIGLSFMNFIIPESKSEVALPLGVEVEVDCAWVVERNGGIHVTACKWEAFGITWICLDICDASNIDGLATCMKTID